MLDGIRRFASFIRRTPLHPQWFAYLRETRNLRRDCAGLAGTVVDVGCAEGLPRNFLPAGTEYIGLDYYATATDWYGTKPDVFGDAQSLPIADRCVDHVLLLDVLEHLESPSKCISEVGRVLKEGGSLIIQVPFMYPIHDAPLDFHRWTSHGLQVAAEQNGFSIASSAAIGHPLETAALTANIAVSKTILNWMSSRNPLALALVLLPFFTVATNILAWFFARLSRHDGFMPYSYRMVWIKR